MRTGRDIPALAAALTLLAGCVTEGGPRAVRPPPRGLDPASLTMVTQNPVDTNENGYRDTMPVVVYVFSSDPAYAAPFTLPAGFDFSLIDADGRELRAWSFPPEVSAKAVRRLAPGPGYIFTLSLLGNGDDVMQAGNARLVGILRQPGSDDAPAPGSLSGPGAPRRPGAAVRAESPPLLVGPVHQTRP